MKRTHHSEYLPIKSLFIKPAENAFISDEILSEQWEELNYLKKPKFSAALIEYNAFEANIKKEGIEVHHFPLQKDLSIDSIYCRDASIATDFGIIICNMGR